VPTKHPTTKPSSTRWFCCFKRVVKKTCGKKKYFEKLPQFCGKIKKIIKLPQPLLNL
jgi:hypothetical protein